MQTHPRSFDGPIELTSSIWLHSQSLATNLTKLRPRQIQAGEYDVLELPIEKTEWLNALRSIPYYLVLE